MSRTIKIMGKYGDNGWEQTGEATPHAIALRMVSEDMAELLHDYLNTGMKDYREGLAVGKLCQSHHRTIQASIIRFCLGVIIAISDTEWTDPRNETPVAMGKEIARQIENGDLKMGWMV